MKVQSERFKIFEFRHLKLFRISNLEIRIFCQKVAGNEMLDTNLSKPEIIITSTKF